jgi:lipopolysaccharide transport system permease protein
VGLIVHGLLAEVLNRAPSLIVSNINYVKKVIFPLEILPAISLLAALFHSMVSILVLLLASAAIKFYLPWTVILFPIVLLPLIMLILGLSWILASLGGFIRDIGQTIGIITTVMLFLAPVFYPLSAMPEKYHPYIMANPLTCL